MSRYKRWATFFACAAAIGTVLAPSALASSGEIAKALANPSWTEAAVAGSATWTGCEQPLPKPEKPPKEPEEPGSTPPEKEPPIPPCSWTAFATVGPGLAAGECSAPGRLDPDSLGAGITLIWQGAARYGAGTDQFDVAGIPLSGGFDQIVCLSAVERAPVLMETDIAPCGKEACPPSYRLASFPRTLASALVPPSLPASEPLPPPAPQSLAPKRRKTCKKQKKRGAKHARRATCKRVKHAKTSDR